jgi:hypothetical protein
VNDTKEKSDNDNNNTILFFARFPSNNNVVQGSDENSYRDQKFNKRGFDGQYIKNGKE